jgi:hypothetical protein
MPVVDSLLAKYQIESPSDRALVRVVAAAVTEAGADKAALLATSGLANRNDLAMAEALVDTVRACTAPDTAGTATSGTRPLRLALGFAALLFLVTAGAYLRARADAKEQGTRLATLTTTHQTELAAVRAELADLAQKSAAGLTQAGLSADAFRAATATYLNDLTTANREIARLNAELSTLKRGSN